MPETIDLIYWPVLLAGAYLLGSIPVAQWIARAHGVDLREVGSGNVGAGNLTKQFGWKWGVTAALLDAAKGFLPVFIALRMGLGPGSAGLAGVAAVIGHNWSIFLRGRSGRGLATSAGMLLALDPVMLVWVGGWSLVGRRFGGGFGGFLGWGLLPIVSAIMGRPGSQTFLYLLLTLVLMGRRVQGNPDSEPGFRASMERVVYDMDRAPELGKSVDEIPPAADDPLAP